MTNSPMRRVDVAGKAARLGVFNIPMLYLAIVAAGLIVFVALLITGFNPPDADVKYDWLVTNEAIRSGGNAHSDIFELADRYGLEISVNADPAVSIERRHPRTPGALLVQVPLALLDLDVLFALTSFISIVSIGWLATVRPREDDDLPSPRAALLLALAVLPSFYTLRFGGQAAVVAVLALAGWLVVRDGRAGLGGLLVGVAAVLKVFPLILFIPLIWHGERRAARAMAATFIGANLAGLALPGVSLSNAVQGLSDATELWRGLASNGSLSQLLDLAGLTGIWVTAMTLVVLVAGAVLLLRSANLPPNPFGWLAIALLALPLSWVSYDLILIPAVVCVFATRSRFALLAGGLVVFLWVSPIAFPWLIGQSGTFSLLARILVISVVVRDGPGAFTGWSLTRSPARESDFETSLT